MNAPVIAIVDDDISIRESLQGLLRNLGCSCRSYLSAESFLEADHEPKLGCLILDVALPGMSGLELFRELRARGRMVPIIFMTGRKQNGLWESLLMEGAAGFLTKPFDDADLSRQLENVLGRAVLQQLPPT